MFVQSLEVRKMSKIVLRKLVVLI